MFLGQCLTEVLCSPGDGILVRSKSGNPCERLMAPYLLDMRVIRRITESVNPAVLVDSGLIVLLILSAKLVIIPQKLYYMAVFPTIFKYLMGDFPYYDLGKTTPQIRQNPFEMP